MKMKSHLRSLTLMLVLIASLAVGVCSCKAWRTITTSATYVQQSDSTKATATITTKTVEEYQGVKKNR